MTEQSKRLEFSAHTMSSLGYKEHAKDIRQLEAQVEALKDKLGNAEFRIVKLEGNLQNIRNIAKLASGTASIIKICDALLERMVSNETEREDWTTRGGRR